ncbi:hypothetical protein SPRG_04552 [Saprolegnia parasitica CBS 223.65]|uniref:Uncharacterized protein n=1 Tax=Saprolegnia parasitica (strain CBS 223.65) TaxID=695850 RepID=A0A067CVX3_SAPPC|nr:hypothetical protein SPRG_04552 [Saprolegnia parasitica CBS 223.65]KDO30651.1 hypothetical protein SPRG_04552 [Saprolegnia parasitica CBS 223.65]|eukprot:XP_012198861.1 hypothetical protein SPRG_04552 [Saprolegnia parasitica CBS 223.65]
MCLRHGLVGSPRVMSLQSVIQFDDTEIGLQDLLNLPIMERAIVMTASTIAASAGVSQTSTTSIFVQRRILDINCHRFSAFTVSVALTLWSGVAIPSPPPIQRKVLETSL